MEGGAKGRDKVYPLGLAAAQGEGHLVEREVVQADLKEETAAGLDFGGDFLIHEPK